MPTLLIEHAISDFDSWKAGFDSDPIGRAGLGVRRHRISRPVDDPAYIVVELDFDTMPQLESCEKALHELWDSGRVSAVLRGEARTRAVESVEEQTY